MSPKRPKLPGNAVDRLSATYQYLLGRKDDNAQPGIESTLNRDVRDALISDELRQEMTRILALLAQQGFCPARISEASLQFQENKFLVTRKDCWFQDLAEDDLVLALAETDKIINSDQTPQHWDWHFEIYNKKPLIKAIILGQPSAVMALAKKGELPKLEILPDALELIGEVQLCQPDLSCISSQADNANMFVIPGAGVLSTGKTLFEAASNLELINKVSEVTLLSK